MHFSMVSFFSTLFAKHHPQRMAVTSTAHASWFNTPVLLCSALVFAGSAFVGSAFAAPQAITSEQTQTPNKKVSQDEIGALLKLLKAGEDTAQPTQLPNTQDAILSFSSGTERLGGKAENITNTEKETQASTQATDFFNPAEKVFNTALDMLGTRYAWGGNNKEQGFDCSGLVKAVYKRALAVELPRSAHAQANSSKLFSVQKNELLAGDLVFFNTRGKRYSHVGIYLGDQQFMHAPRRGKNVRIDSIGKSYWSKRFTGGRRALEILPTHATAPVLPLQTTPLTENAKNTSLQTIEPFDHTQPASHFNTPDTNAPEVPDMVLSGERS